MSVRSDSRWTATVEADHKDKDGRLISRSISIQAPTPPKCVKPKCLWKFFLDILFCAWLSRYHGKRQTYAERNRHREIPMKYRTGEDSPTTIKGAIWGVIKLSFLLLRR